MDSVEVTNDRAVVIGRKQFVPNVDAWVISAYSISLTQGLVLLQEWAGGAGNPPHDVMMSPDLIKAVIKTRANNIVLNNVPGITSTPNANDITVLASIGDPNADNTGTTDHQTFVSDSVDVTRRAAVPVPVGSSDPGIRQYAVFIGSYIPQLSAPRAASIEVVDLMTIPASAVPTATWPVVDPGFKTVPADVDLLGVRGPLCVRTNAPPDTTGTVRDYLQYSLGPNANTANIGGKGFVFAIDSLVTSTSRAVSLAEDSNPQYTTQRSFVHFVDTTP